MSGVKWTEGQDESREKVAGEEWTECQDVFLRQYYVGVGGFGWHKNVGAALCLSHAEAFML